MYSISNAYILSMTCTISMRLFMEKRISTPKRKFKSCMVSRKTHFKVLKSAFLQKRSLLGAYFK